MGAAGRTRKSSTLAGLVRKGLQPTRVQRYRRGKAIEAAAAKPTKPALIHKQAANP